MQTVSQAWKDEQKKTLVGESFVEVTLSVGDPESQADAQPSDNGSLYLSDTEKLTDGSDRAPGKYLTLETNLWALDGTLYSAPMENTENNEGFISSVLCDEDSKFDELIPTVTITFSKVFTELIPGITVKWSEAYGECAKKFRVTAYSGETVTGEAEIDNNTDITSAVYLDINEYDKIVLEALEWCIPNRRARIESVSIGIVKTYTKSELMSYTHSSFVDPLSAELPKNQIVFEIANLNGEYNPDNPAGAEKYLMERQSVDVRYGYKLDGKVEWIPAGSFYMSEWDSPQNGITAAFTARDGLEYMNDVYAGATNGTLYSIAEAAFTQAALPKRRDGGDNWYISDTLQAVTAPSTVELDEGVTIGEVLQYVANAGCCVFYQGRSGVMRIEPLGDSVTDYEIDQFVSYSNSELALSKPLKAVNINNGQYVLTVGGTGETQYVSNPFISEERAPTVAQWVADHLGNRQTLTGEFRADPRLDALDRVTNINQFAEKTVLVTEITYSYAGAFRGSYSGRAGV